MPQRPRVTVLGSLNADISLPVPRLPGAGETVLAHQPAVVGGGGKGANQAVAAARLGASVRLAGCCGDDEFGERLRAGLAGEGVDVSGVRIAPGTSSGLALITVDPAGENAIAVAPGANGLVGEAEVAAAFAAPCDVLVLSAEVPVAALAAALREAARRGVATVLNLAPVPEGADTLLSLGASWLVVNETEAGALLRQLVEGTADAAAAAMRLVTGGVGEGPGGGDGASSGYGLGSGDGPGLGNGSGSGDGPEGNGSGSGDGPGLGNGPGSGPGPGDDPGARQVVITLGAAGAVLG
ncbi:MAG TPA: PfkB family carbohydrate kinase, partial [Streptosporangiaceae bacterium]